MRSTVHHMLASAVLLAAAPTYPALAQGGGEARPAGSAARHPSPDIGAGETPAQARRDTLSGYSRAPTLPPSRTNPDQAGNAASDGTAGLSSPRAPEPKPGG